MDGIVYCITGLYFVFFTKKKRSQIGYAFKYLKEIK